MSNYVKTCFFLPLFLIVTSFYSFSGIDGSDVYNEQNFVFRKILAPLAKGEPPAEEPLSLTEHSLTLYDANHAFDEHILVVPKGKYSNLPHFLADATDAEKLDFFNLLSTTILERVETNARGHVIMNTGSAARQTVAHLHAHVLAGKQRKFDPFEFNAAAVAQLPRNTSDLLSLEETESFVAFAAPFETVPSHIIIARKTDLQADASPLSFPIYLEQALRHNTSELLDFLSILNKVLQMDRFDTGARVTFNFGGQYSASPYFHAHVLGGEELRDPEVGST